MPPAAERPSGALAGKAPAQPELLLDLDDVGLLMPGANVLMLSPTPTHPTDQGNRKRIYAVCKMLQERGVKVHFLYYPQEWWFEFLPTDWVDAMRSSWDSFHMVPVTRQTYQPPKGTDYSIDEWWDESIGVTLAWLFKRQHFDAFIVNYAYMSKAFEFAPPGVLRILDTHDKFTGRRELLQQNNVAPEFFYTTQEEETKAVNRADLVWAIKEQEAEFYRSLGKVPCLTMPHAEPTAPVARVRRPEDQGRLVLGMLGSGNVINVRNAKAFVHAALPIFEEARVPVVIRYVGSMCDRMPELAHLDGVELAGPVDTVEEFYRDVDVVVIPLAFSTGLKIKAVEAFAANMPIVAMGHALEGIPVEHPWHLCESMKEVAQVCCELAARPDRVDELRRASWQVHARMVKMARDVLDQTLRRVMHRPTVLMPIDVRFFEPEGLYREHVHQSVNLALQQGRVVLYVDQPLNYPQTQMLAACHGLAQHCKLVVAPSAAPQRPISLGLTHMVADLETVLQQLGRPMVWLERLPDALREKPWLLAKHPSCIVRLDVMRQLDGEAVLEALATCLPHWPQALVLDSHDAAAAPEGLRAEQRALVPYWRWKPWQLAERGDRLMLICTDELAPATAQLAGVLCLSEPALSVVVLSPNPVQVDDLPGRVSLTSMAQAWRSFRSLKPLPAMALDLSGGAPGLEPLRETLRWAKVPVAEARTADEEITLLDLLERLRHLWATRQGRAERADNEVKARYAGEAGWNRVWRNLANWRALS